MEKSHALRLLEYDFWANNRVFEAISKSNKALPEDLEDILSHIFGAKEIWLKRSLIEPASSDLFNRKSIQELEHLNNRLNSDWKNFLSTNSTGHVVSYSNLSGEKFQTPLSDIITHIVNHGSYHRGQVARTLRESGITPIATDFIVYCRESD
jgi:uncharacterized damage-inducible protein DinB